MGWTEEMPIYGDKFFQENIPNSDMEENVA